MIGHRLIYWFVVFTPVTASELDEYEKAGQMKRLLKKDFMRGIKGGIDLFAE